MKREPIAIRPASMHPPSMTRGILTRTLIAFACLLISATSASAQSISGEVVEAMTAQPLRTYPVRLYYLAQGDSTTACDSTTTDERGLFQFGGVGPGAYRVEFGPSASRLASGARVEAGTRDTSIALRFKVPVLELGGAQAFSSKDVQEVAQQRAVIPVRYPEDLRSLAISGEVDVRFIVDTTGRVRAGSVTVLRSTHPSFTRAVTEYLRTTKYHPARVGGIAVAQLVEQPFTFSLDRR
jgi:TonB family protein